MVQARQEQTQDLNSARPQARRAPMTDDLDTAQKEIARLTLELNRARSELEEFTYSVSHDLRASLRHVTAYVQIIKEDLGGSSDKGITASLDTVSVAAKHMALLIDGLMELSRVGQVGIATTRIDTSQLIAELKNTLVTDVAGRQIDWSIAPDFPLVVGDPALIRQVWSKLLTNALKYTRSRADTRIEINWVLVEGGFCEFHILDNGVGFNPRFKEKLFKVFQRLHSATEFEGTGLGLALTRKIVERHGGIVWAEGDVDAGCDIGFTLPMALRESA
jgi:light-regulated signal transduction histidine kinase (bacteriophytochrome)